MNNLHNNETSGTYGSVGIGGWPLDPPGEVDTVAMRPVNTNSGFTERDDRNPIPVFWVGLARVKAGDWFDVRELSLFVGVLP